jgi:hypothetical protein
MNQLEKMGFPAALRDYYGLKEYLAVTLAELIFNSPKIVYFESRSNSKHTYIATIRKALVESGTFMDRQCVKREGAGYWMTPTDALRVINEIATEYCTQPAQLPNAAQAPEPTGVAQRKSNDRRFG